jgi:L-alanine-DL-glutamate epimerase-like enolase superfamily enzyme
VFEAERVSEKMRQLSFWYGRGGAVEHTISGLDIALWDLMGKALNQPVSRLLGGNYRDRMKPYASILFDQPPILQMKLHEQVKRGFKAIKMGWRPFGRVSRQFDELLIKTARDTVGEDVELMVDAGGSEQFWPHGVSWARETAKMLGDYQVVWFEEALKPDDLDGFKELRQTSPVKIATGEVFTRRQTFQPYITQRALDIIQPDLTKCGGLSEGRRMAWMAYDHGVLLVPHGWNTAVGVAADLALTGRRLGRVPDRRSLRRRIDRAAVQTGRRRDAAGADRPRPGHHAEPGRRREVLARAVREKADDCHTKTAAVAGATAAVSLRTRAATYRMDGIMTWYGTCTATWTGTRSVTTSDTSR